MEQFEEGPEPEVEPPSEQYMRAVDLTARYKRTSNLTPDEVDQLGGFASQVRGELNGYSWVLPGLPLGPRIDLLVPLAEFAASLGLDEADSIYLVETEILQIAFGVAPSMEGDPNDSRAVYAYIKEHLPSLAGAIRALGRLIVWANGQPPAAKTSDAAVRLLNIYTNGLADERLEKASSVLNSDRTVDEKLWEIDELMPIPPSVPAQKLGKALGVSKTAVQKTSWYDQKRKGRKDEEIDEREGRLRQRGQEYERDRQADDD